MPSLSYLAERRDITKAVVEHYLLFNSGLLQHVVTCRFLKTPQVSTNGEISIISGAPTDCDCKIDPNCDCFSGGSPGTHTHTCYVRSAGLSNVNVLDYA